LKVTREKVFLFRLKVKVKLEKLAVTAHYSLGRHSRRSKSRPEFRTEI